MEYINYIKPELLILVPVLWLLGSFLKHSPIGDKNIPWILGSVSILLSSLWVASNGFEDIYNAMLTAVIQGILCAGAAVYGNQVFKQYRKDE